MTIIWVCTSFVGNSELNEIYPPTTAN